MNTSRINLEQLKRDAKRLKKTTPGLTHTQAIERLARELGYKSYAALRAAQKELT